MKKILSLSFFVIVIFLVPLNSMGQDEILFRRHLVNSGVHGLYYGIAADLIFEIDGAASTGIPIITSGVSVLVPLLINSDRNIDYDALVLNGHGKSIGWFHGMALATLIGGEDAWTGGGFEDTGNNYKYTIGLGALSSIGLGILGKSLARNNDWSDGKVELFRHYGWVMPFTGFSIAASFSDDPRFFGGAILAFGAGGYLLANSISNRHDFTRGEMRATQVLSTMNLGLGWGIFADRAAAMDYTEDFNRTDWLIPAAGALAGTLIGHIWLKDTGLTPQQGMLTAYAATGGALVGLGGALITESEKVTPYYLLPYLGGLAAYTITVEMLRKRNNTQAQITGSHDNNFQFQVMPQSIFLNNKIVEKGYILNGRQIRLQPLVTASFTF